jgi:hypothetical protein
VEGIYLGVDSHAARTQTVSSSRVFLYVCIVTHINGRNSRTSPTFAISRFA